MTKAVLIFFFLWLCFPLAADSGISVFPVSDAPVMGRPGEVITLVFKVKNERENEVQLRPQWKLPQGWLPISNSKSFRLAAGQSSLQLFSVHAPTNAMAGVFPVKFEIVSASSGQTLGEATAEVEIEAVNEISLVTGNAPELVVAGETIFADFILHNRSNSTQTISLLAENCELKEGNRILLEPGGQMVIHVKSETYATIRHSGRKILRLHAHLAGSPEVTAYASHFVRILPQASLELVEGRELPVTLRLSHLTRKFRDGQVVSGLQGEVHVRGSLDEAGQNQVEMRLRGPDRFNLSVLGQYEEHFASFKNEKIYAHIGDKTYTLSPLTEFSRYGRGAEASFRVRDVEVGGFYQQPRFFPGVEDERAAYFRYHYDQANRIGLNLMQKNYGQERGDATLVSLHGTATIRQHTQLEGEISQGSREDTWGNGLFLRANSQPTERLQAAVNFIHTDKYYPGYFNNSTSFYGQVGYQVSKKLSLSVHLNQDQRNPSQDTLFGQAPWSRLAQVSAGYKLGKSTSLRAILRSSEMLDRMPDVKFHYTDNVLRLQLVKNWNRLRTSLTGEFGQRENLLNQPGERTATTYRAFVNGNYNISQRFSTIAFAQFYHYDQFVGTQEQQWIFGASLNALLTPFTRFRLAYQNNFLLEEYYRNRNLLDISLNQQFGKKKNHELSASCNYVLLQRTQQETDFSVNVNYAWRFGIRVRSKDAVQGVYGQISNRGVKSVEGILLLLNGQQALTKTDGSFSFENVPPGKYYLMLDPTTVNLHDVPDEPLPLEVTVESGVDTRLDFGLTKGASLNGKILVEPEHKPTRNPGGGNAPRIFMFEISNGKETYRRISDENSYFEFRDLRPGNWKLKILNEDSMPGYHFERTEWELELLPGTEKRIDIQLLRKRKKIKFQDKLSLTSK